MTQEFRCRLACPCGNFVTASTSDERVECSCGNVYAVTVTPIHEPTAPGED